MKQILLLLLILNFFTLYAQDKVQENNEVMEVIEQLENNLNYGDRKLLGEMLAIDEFVNLAIGSFNLDPTFLKDFKIGFQEKIYLIGDQFMLSVGEASIIKHQKIIYDNDTTKVLFRISSEGANYIDIFFVKMENIYKIVDIFLYVQGERWSKSTKNLLMPMLLTSQEPKLLKFVKRFFLQGNNSQYINDIDKFNELNQLYLNKEYQKAYDLALTIKSDLKNTEAFYIKLIQISGEVDEKKMLEYLNEFSEKFPDNKSLSFILIDKYALENDMLNLRRCIDEFMVITPKDGFLLNLKAYSYSAEGNTDKFLETLDLAITLEPDFENAYFSLIEFYISIFNFKDLIPLIEKMKVNTGSFYTESSLKENDFFTRFLESEEYKSWDKTEYFKEE